MADLVAGVLRTPGTPERSFGDDPFADDAGCSVRVPTGNDDRAGGSGRHDGHGVTVGDRLGGENTRRVGETRDGRGSGRRPAVLVDTGLADMVLPELPALSLEIDEHHHHKGRV